MNRFKYSKRRVCKYFRKNYLSIVALSFSILIFVVTQMQMQSSLLLTESWRNAVSKSLEIEGEGEHAYPLKRGEKWSVALEPEPSVEMTFEISSTVVFTRRNET